MRTVGRPNELERLQVGNRVDIFIPPVGDDRLLRRTGHFAIERDDQSVTDSTPVRDERSFFLQQLKLGADFAIATNKATRLGHSEIRRTAKSRVKLEPVCGPDDALEAGFFGNLLGGVLRAAFIRIAAYAHQPPKPFVPVGHG